MHCSLPCDLVQQPLITASIAVVSTQLVSNISSQNISSTNFSKFSYIIPFDHTQDCNIYGPICQTGSITVGVNLTTATTTTVLPCSSYLSAQSTYLDSLCDSFWAYDTPDPMNWGTNFGQSPDCRSYAEDYRQGQFTFSGCGNSNIVVQTQYGVPSQIPPGVLRYFDPNAHSEQEFCCGSCAPIASEVRLYYFPDKMTIDCPKNETLNLTSSLSTRNIRKRMHSLIVDESTTVVSGHTL